MTKSVLLQKTNGMIIILRLKWFCWCDMDDSVVYMKRL